MICIFWLKLFFTSEKFQTNSHNYPQGKRRRNATWNLWDSNYFGDLYKTAKRKSRRTLLISLPFHNCITHHHLLKSGKQPINNPCIADWRGIPSHINRNVNNYYYYVKTKKKKVKLRSGMESTGNFWSFLDEQTWTSHDCVGDATSLTP